MVCLQSQCAGERAAMRAAVRSVRGTIASARRGHHKYGVRKEHYPQLLVVLTSTVESTLDKPWSEEQQTAWSNVLSFIVSVIDEAYAEGAQLGADRTAAMARLCISAQAFLPLYVVKLSVTFCRQ